MTLGGDDLPLTNWSLLSALKGSSEELSDSSDGSTDDAGPEDAAEDPLFALAHEGDPLSDAAYSKLIDALMSSSDSDASEDADAEDDDGAADHSHRGDANAPGLESDDDSMDDYSDDQDDYDSMEEALQPENPLDMCLAQHLQSFGQRPRASAPIDHHGKARGSRRRAPRIPVPWAFDRPPASDIRDLFLTDFRPGADVPAPKAIPHLAGSGVVHAACQRDPFLHLALLVDLKLTLGSFPAGGDASPASNGKRKNLPSLRGYVGDSRLDAPNARSARAFLDRAVNNHPLFVSVARMRLSSGTKGQAAARSRSPSLTGQVYQQVLRILLAHVLRHLAWAQPSIQAALEGLGLDYTMEAFVGRVHEGQLLAPPSKSHLRLMGYRVGTLPTGDRVFEPKGAGQIRAHAVLQDAVFSEILRLALDSGFSQVPATVAGLSVAALGPPLTLVRATSEPAPGGDEGDPPGSGGPAGHRGRDLGVRGFTPAGNLSDSSSSSDDDDDDHDHDHDNDDDGDDDDDDDAGVEVAPVDAPANAPSQAPTEAQMAREARRAATSAASMELPPPASTPPMAPMTPSSGRRAAARHRHDAIAQLAVLSAHLPIGLPLPAADAQAMARELSANASEGHGAGVDFGQLTPHERAEFRSLQLKAQGMLHRSLLASLGVAVDVLRPASSSDGSVNDLSLLICWQRLFAGQMGGTAAPLVSWLDQFTASPHCENIALPAVLLAPELRSSVKDILSHLGLTHKVAGKGNYKHLSVYRSRRSRAASADLTEAGRPIGARGGRLLGLMSQFDSAVGSILRRKLAKVPALNAGPNGRKSRNHPRLESGFVSFSRPAVLSGTMNDPLFGDDSIFLDDEPVGRPDARSESGAESDDGSGTWSVDPSPSAPMEVDQPQAGSWSGSPVPPEEGQEPGSEPRQSDVDAPADSAPAEEEVFTFRMGSPSPPPADPDCELEPFEFFHDTTPGMSANEAAPAVWGRTPTASSLVPLGALPPSEVAPQPVPSRRELKRQMRQEQKQQALQQTLPMSVAALQLSPAQPKRQKGSLPTQPAALWRQFWSSERLSDVSSLMTPAGTGVRPSRDIGSPAGTAGPRLGKYQTPLPGMAVGADAPPIDATNVGRQMLERMGWRSGEGLGRDGSGQVDNIEVLVRRERSGLGSR
ncbi:hypothetical protein, variant [Fonticula alba]|nr:hypothetical protein, variant [Fonticula alba]KCV68375.1 hypothetical protein, variant [Fonticula alba]|eukprot:XP_009497429.1 hypothetical protein, variant [Fonticula alba]